MSRKYPKLVTCLLNVSEGRDEAKIARMVECTVRRIEREKAKATLLNVFQDKDYNRTVLTLSGTGEGVTTAVLAAAQQAYASIDLNHHHGGHPRLGAVDLIPIHPITPDISVQECSSIATNIAQQLNSKVKESSFFFYGAADKLKRSLIQRRKQIGWFKSRLIADPDLGIFHSAAGITGVGGSHYMTNFNITIDTQDMTIGEDILRRIRGREGGFHGVSAMALPHQEGIEIACNVDMVEKEGLLLEGGEGEDLSYVQAIRPGLYRTKFSCIEDTVGKVCALNNIKIRGESVIVGFTLEDLHHRTVEALNQSQAEAITKSGPIMM